MKIINIHKRVIDQPLESISPVLDGLPELWNMFWPIDKWPRINFKDGLKIGNPGGHGPIRYDIEQYKPGEYIQFKFTRPKGIDGYHKLELTDLYNKTTELKHSIIARSSGRGTLKWLVAIRWLHDALIVDALDKIENHFSDKKKYTPYNVWVRILRRFAQ